MKRLKEKKRIRAALCLAMMVICLLMVSPIFARALFDENKAVHIKAGQIENSTLIVGTHLISLQAMNDKIYQIAEKSASESGQDRVYYKSELANGSWFDITDAAGINEITTAGTPVKTSEIEALFMTHQTKADGTTYDLRTGQAVNIFEIDQIYDIENLSEMEPLKLQLDRMKESEHQTATDKRNTELVEQFFRTNVTSEESEVCDGQMASLQTYYEKLKSDGAESPQTDAVIDVMDKIDNVRKKAVYTVLERGIAELFEKVSDSHSDDSDTEYYEIDDALLTAISSCQSNLTESLAETQSNILEEGETIFSKKEYAKAQELISAVLGNDGERATEICAELTALKNITEDRSTLPEKEAELLKEMAESAEEVYASQISGGISEAYREALEKEESDAVKEGILEADKAELNRKKGEAEYLVEACVKRLDAKAADPYLMERIQKSALLLAEIQEDAYQDIMTASVLSYQNVLSDISSGKKKESDKNGIGKLQEEKAQLQEERMAALDTEDLDQAKVLQAKIEEVDQAIQDSEKASENEIAKLQEDISELESKLTAEPQNVFLLQQKAELERQLANESASLSEKGMASNVQVLKKEALELLRSDDTSDTSVAAIMTDVEGLSGALDADSEMALAALKEIYEEISFQEYVKETDAYDGIGSVIESAMTNSDMLTIRNNGMTLEMALEIINEFTEGKAVSYQNGAAVSYEGMSTDEIIAVVLSVAEYADAYGNEELQTVTQGMIANLSGKADIPVFESYEEAGIEYGPADSLAAYAGYRYLWNSTRKTAILSQGRKYYTFTAFYSAVTVSDDTEYMDAETKFRGTVYIPESYLESTFLCNIERISGTDYSVLVNDTILELSDKMAEALVQKGGI